MLLWFENACIFELQRHTQLNYIYHIIFFILAGKMNAIVNHNISHAVVFNPRSHLINSNSNRKQLSAARESLYDNPSEINISISHGGISRHEDDLCCGKGTNDGTTHHMFEFVIDIKDEKPYPPQILSFDETDDLVRQLMKDKMGIELPKEAYDVFMVGPRDKDTKKPNASTARMRLILIPGRELQGLTFVPGEHLIILILTIFNFFYLQLIYKISNF
jgi:hypothetical protein